MESEEEYYEKLRIRYEAQKEILEEIYELKKSQMNLNTWIENRLEELEETFN